MNPRSATALEDTASDVMASNAMVSDVEHQLVAVPRAIAGAEHLGPFVRAAREVLGQELGCEVRPGQFSVADAPCTTHEVTAIVGIVGDLTGMATYGMSEATALAIVGRLMGAPLDEMDELALSGIGELANVMTGVATTLIARVGLAVDIAPPVLLLGAGSRLSTAGIGRLVVPLETALGTVEAQLAIRPPAIRESR